METIGLQKDPHPPAPVICNTESPARHPLAEDFAAHGAAGSAEVFRVWGLGFGFRV